MKDESSPCEERDLHRSDQDQSELPFPTHDTASLPVVFWSKAQVDLDVPQAAQVRAVEQMDRGVVDPDDVLVEQGPEEPRANVVDGHPSAELVEGRHDDRLFRQLRISLVLPQGWDSHPTRHALTMPHRGPARGGGMVVARYEHLPCQRLPVRPRT